MQIKGLLDENRHDKEPDLKCPIVKDKDLEWNSNDIETRKAFKQI